MLILFVTSNNMKQQRSILRPSPQIGKLIAYSDAAKDLKLI